MPISVGVGLDPATTTWVNTVTAAGGTFTGSQKFYVNNLVRALKFYSIWSSLDALWLLAAQNTTQALTDLVGPRVETVHGTPTFTAGVGYTGDASAAYLDTGLAQNGGTNYAQNSACHFGWIASAATGTTQAYWSSDDSNSSDALFRRTSSTADAFAANAASTGSFTYTTQTGFFHVERSASALTTLYQNGSSTGTTSTAASTALVTGHWFILADNNAGTAEHFGNGQVAVFGTGAALGSTNAGLLYTAVQQYLHSTNSGSF